MQTEVAALLGVSEEEIAKVWAIIQPEVETILLKLLQEGLAQAQANIQKQLGETKSRVKKIELKSFSEIISLIEEGMTAPSAASPKVNKK
jgi:hypothetical protein